MVVSVIRIFLIRQKRQIRHNHMETWLICVGDVLIETFRRERFSSLSSLLCFHIFQVL